MRYETAAAFRRALADHLSNRARREGVPVSRLQKQLAFERFLARLFRGEAQRWVLKGGYALELRLPGTARATRDLDLNVPPPAAPDLLDELQRAAELDMGDFFAFTVSAPASRGHLAGPPLGGFRFSVEARLDGRRCDRFPLDVGQGDVTVREPDRVRGQVDLTFADLATPEFAVYPLEDHFAEKLHAYTTPRANPSRVKDLGHVAPDRTRAGLNTPLATQHRGNLRPLCEAHASTGAAQTSTRLAGGVRETGERGRSPGTRPG